MEGHTNGLRPLRERVKDAETSLNNSRKGREEGGTIGKFRVASDKKKRNPDGEGGGHGFIVMAKGFLINGGGYNHENPRKDNHVFHEQLFMT